MAPTPAMIPISTPSVSHFWTYEAPLSQRDVRAMAARHEVRLSAPTP
jgi:hypothetical protein